MALADMGGAGSVKGLDVDEGMGTRTVKTTEDHVGAVGKAREAVTPLVEGAAVTTALGEDAVGAEDSVAEGDEGEDGGGMRGDVAAKEEGTGDVVAVAGEDGVSGMVMGRTLGAHSDGPGAVDVDGREEEEILGEGDREGRRLGSEGEEGGGGVILWPGASRWSPSPARGRGQRERGGGRGEAHRPPELEPGWRRQGAG